MAHSTGPISTETQIPCGTLVACLLRTAQCHNFQYHIHLEFVASMDKTYEPATAGGGEGTHTHVGNRETRTKQEKRLKENSSGTAELS